MKCLVEVNGHILDVSKIERITPIESTYTGASCYEQAFTVHFRNHSFTVYITDTKYYNCTYRHTAEEMQALQEKHNKVVNAYKNFSENPAKHYLIRWKEIEYARHEEENDYYIPKCETLWLTDEELKSFCLNKGSLKVTHLGN